MNERKEVHLIGKENNLHFKRKKQSKLDGKNLSKLVESPPEENQLAIMKYVLIQYLRFVDKYSKL